MYSSFFKLKVNPFGETPDTKFFYKSESHVKALGNLLAALKAGKGFTLITGEVGVGKTILSRLLVNYLHQYAPTALILNPILNQQELLASIREEFKLPASSETGLKSDYNELAKFFIQTAKSGKRSVLIIDEAQRLTFEGLECVRLLSNLESEQSKLLQIVLIGQSELIQRLEQFDLRQLNQRITSRAQLTALTKAEVDFYVRHRVELAGGANFVRFESDAVSLVTKATGGIPRLINSVCERALTAAERAQVRLIDAKFLKSVDLSVPRAEKPSRWASLFSQAKGLEP